ncbi:MAG: hemerythrin domain-containing protein [Bacteroidia bacterium]
MKIIDKETGKRVGSKNSEIKSINKKLKEEDPIVKNAEKDQETEEFSPMDPPDAYDKKRVIGANYEAMDKHVKELMDEHAELEKIAAKFETALIEFKTSGFVFTKEINDTFNEFFTFFDEHILPHNRKEERHLFPILHQRLIESGEHGVGDNPETAVDLMEDDHVKFIQLATLSFNLLGLGSRLTDLNSRALTYDLACNSGKELVELLRLHVYREDNTLFPLAQKLLTAEDFAKIHAH